MITKELAYFYDIIHKADVKKFKQLIVDGFDITVNDNFAIKYACFVGNVKMTKLLLKQPEVDPSAENNYCLYYSVYNNNINIIKMLLNDSRIDPSADHNHSFYAALMIKNYDAMKLLLQDIRVIEKLNIQTVRQNTIIFKYLREILGLSSNNEVENVLKII
jgi:hypothetical protein